jgi:hypothetical protein
MGQKECFKIRNISILFLVLMFLSFFNCDGEKDARSKSHSLALSLIQTSMNMVERLFAP